MSEFIPTIDLRSDAGIDEQTNIKRIVKELSDAFSTLGMAYVKNHGIPKEKVEDLLRVSRIFYALPLDVKAPHNGSYVGQAAFPGFCSKSIAKLEPGYMYDGTLYEKREFFDFNAHDGIYPDDVCPELRGPVVALAAEFKPFTTRMLHYLALSLKNAFPELPEDFFTRCHQHQFEGTDKNPTFVRTQYYPELLANDDLEIRTTVGIRPHTDFGTVTFIFADEEIGGLEVEIDGKWVPVPYIPGTMLMIAGNMLSRWTADHFKAAFHRVIRPFRSDGSSPMRQSVGYFVHPDAGTVVTPLTKTDKYEAFEAKTDFFDQFHYYRNNNIRGSCQVTIESIRQIMNKEKNAVHP